MRTIIAANWKMNKTRTEAKATAHESPLSLAARRTIGMSSCSRRSPLWKPRGKASTGPRHLRRRAKYVPRRIRAFTGEISPNMLVDAGVKYVVIGHSERREYFAETDETVNKRTLAALNAGLKVLVCVGENLTQREQGVTEELVRMQTKIALNA